MSAEFKSSNLTVDAQGITLNGQAVDESTLLNAEAIEVTDMPRSLVITAFGLFGPILVMIALTMSGSIQAIRESASTSNAGWYLFTPVVLIGCVLPGIIACAIALKWPKPWGVVVERENRGHDKLTRCASKDEAEKAAAAIRSRISPS